MDVTFQSGVQRLWSKIPSTPLPTAFDEHGLTAADVHTLLDTKARTHLSYFGRVSEHANLHHAFSQLMRMPFFAQSITFDDLRFILYGMNPEVRSACSCSKPVVLIAAGGKVLRLCSLACRGVVENLSKAGRYSSLRTYDRQRGTTSPGKKLARATSPFRYTFVRREKGSIRRFRGTRLESVRRSLRV